MIKSVAWIELEEFCGELLLKNLIVFTICAAQSLYSYRCCEQVSSYRSTDLQSLEFVDSTGISSEPRARHAGTCWAGSGLV